MSKKFGNFKTVWEKFGNFGKIWKFGKKQNWKFEKRNWKFEKKNPQNLEKFVNWEKIRTLENNFEI